MDQRWPYCLQEQSVETTGTGEQACQLHWEEKTLAIPRQLRAAAEARVQSVAGRCLSLRVPVRRVVDNVTPAMRASSAYMHCMDTAWWAAWLGRHTAEKIAVVP